jgi:hypothetical protein
MATLHIEHAITDFDTWSSAFERFGDTRRDAGVRTARVRRPIEDSRYVVIDLEFDTTGEAEAFLRILQDQVWPHSPALVGTPQTAILESAALG